jgi:CarboxypepD_reg-like domain
MISLIFQANSGLLFPQSPYFIAGKVINSVTTKPVPFATIKLKNNHLGVYANADGDFKVSLNPDFQDDSLLITCIGFKENSVAYKDLSNIKENRILLLPVVYGLGEVSVVASRKKQSSLAIIRRAIRNISNNYPDKPFNFISYYRDYQKKDSNYINLNEAIVQTFDDGFSSGSDLNKYRLLGFRKNTNFPTRYISPYYTVGYNNYDGPDKTIPEGTLGDQYGNELFVLMKHDALRNFNKRSFSFVETFSQDFIIYHYFSEPTTVLNNNLLLYKINFTAKQFVAGDSLSVSGAIYIQPADYSIHKLEYSTYKKTRDQRLKQIYNIVIEYGKEQSADSRMCLKYISFNNLFKIIDSTDNTYFRVLNSYMDTIQNVNPTVVLNFNNKIDRFSASKKENYKIKIGKKDVKITSIQVIDKTLYLRFKNEYLKGRQPRCTVAIQDVKDVNGNIINKLKSLELYQYRELFVQDYNKSLPYQDSCFIKYLPLEQNCISKYSGNFNYWMNTPDNIKNNGN